MTGTPPPGLWAVADGLAGPAQAEAWLAGTRGAAARTFRRPQGGDRLAVAALRRFVADGRWTAVHARADLAAAAGAQAWIAGARSLPNVAVRTVFPALQRGASVHDAVQIEAARAAGAAFLVYGPVWETPSKRGILEPRGVAGLRAAVASGIPVVAIGGVDRADRIQACRIAGAHACAVLRSARDAARFARLVAAWSAVAAG
ncbi:MAG TPA: thiamine phosphate synthase [Planctomycetota bacterium]